MCVVNSTQQQCQSTVECKINKSTKNCENALFKMCHCVSVTSCLTVALNVYFPASNTFLRWPSNFSLRRADFLPRLIVPLVTEWNVATTCCIDRRKLTENTNRKIAANAFPVWHKKTQYIRKNIKQILKRLWLPSGQVMLIVVPYCGSNEAAGEQAKESEQESF